MSKTAFETDLARLSDFMTDLNESAALPPLGAPEFEQVVGTGGDHLIEILPGDDSVGATWLGDPVDGDVGTDTLQLNSTTGDMTVNFRDDVLGGFEVLSVTGANVGDIEINASQLADVTTYDVSGNAAGSRLEIYLDIVSFVNLSAISFVGVDTAAGDQINVYGGTNAETLIGSDQADYLSGDGGDDVIYGMAGNDTLVGGTGIDSMYGGDGGGADAA